MPLLSLIGGVIAIILLLPVRIALQRRWTGSSGIAATRAAPGIPRWSVLLLAVGTLVTPTGPLLHVLSAGPSWEPLDTYGVHMVGALLLVDGTAWAFWAQVSMREAWRLGQDDNERLRLITSGPFTYIRHPIYTGLIAVAFGITLLDPTPLGFFGACAMTLGIALQATHVEEPRMLEVHGQAYVEWARHTGRFLPPLRPARPAPTAGSGRPPHSGREPASG